MEECRKVLHYLDSLATTHNLSESQSTIQNLHKYFTQFDDIKTITGLLNTPIEPTNIKMNEMEIIENVEENNDENVEEIIQKVSQSAHNVCNSKF